MSNKKSVDSSSSKNMVSFDSEAALVARFLEALKNGEHPWTVDLRIAMEFNYLRGKTDVVAVTPECEVVAFEAKLSRWKEALHQAYRNTCFAHRSYVLLPEAASTSPKRFLRQFERRRVGLCILGAKGLTVVIEAPLSNPLQPKLADEAIAQAAVPL